VHGYIDGALVVEPKRKDGIHVERESEAFAPVVVVARQAALGMVRAGLARGEVRTTFGYTLERLVDERS